MTLSPTPGSLKRFRRTPWRFQQTFRTPLKNLLPYVSTIVSSHNPLQAASVTIDQIVFEPKHLISLFSRYSLPTQCERDWSVAATGEREVAELLETALSD